MKRLFMMLILLIVMMLPGIIVTGQDTATVEAIIADLEGLPFDDFLDQSYNQFLLRDPETITDLGIADQFGTGNSQLTNISDAYLRETQALEIAVLELLQQYDREALTPEQLLTYDIYEWYLDDQVRGHEFMYYSYPVSQFFVSVPDNLVYLMTELHPIANREDAEDYISRLSQFDIKFEQLLEGLRLNEGAGATLPRYLIPWTINNLENIARGRATNTPFYTVFREKLNTIDDLSDSEKDALLESAATEIENTVMPAFRSIIAYMSELQRVASNDTGVWKFPNGEAYYQYMLRKRTTTTMTPDQIHQLGLREVERIRAEMRLIFDELGYPADESLVELYGRVTSDGGVVYGDDITAEYEGLIDEMALRLPDYFDLLPVAEVIVIRDPNAGGGYYQPPALDGSRPGAFYASPASSVARFNMASLTYHEAVPGHHLQIALAQEMDLPFFRQNAGFTAYIEGWALYAERLAWEMGLYDDDPYGNLGRLQYEAFRAVRLVVDTGIHAQGWDFDQAVEYFVANTGFPARTAQWEIGRYVVWPAQSTAYLVGMLEILDLRQSAMDQLGDKFDIREFHNVILGNGSMPLDLLRQVVDAYIADTLAS